MAEQIRRRKEHVKDTCDNGAAPEGRLTKRGDALKKSIDDIIDDIDDVLEENAEEFLKEYVQRGGE